MYYVFCRVKLISNVAGNYGALSDVLIADENNLKLLDGIAVGRKADAIAHLNYQI